MHCSKCCIEVSQDASFCQKCGAPLSPTSSASGDGSVNVAGSNNVSNSHLHVGDVYQSQKPEDTAYIDRTSVISIKGQVNNCSSFIYYKFWGLLSQKSNQY